MNTAINFRRSPMARRLSWLVVAGLTTAAAPTLEAVYTFHHNLARSLAGYNDVKIVTSRPESANWVLIFTSPTDTAPPTGE